MPLKDILVHTDNSGNSEIRLDFATRLAADHDAFLTGLYVATPSGAADGAGPKGAAYALPDLGGRSLREYEKKADELNAIRVEHARFAADSARQRFAAKAGAAGIGHEWRHVEGPMMEALTHNARFCDVAVVGQPGPDSARRFGETVPDHLVLSVGHPVLVVPTLDKGFSVGKRIIIAWDRSPLATRAVHNSRPFMRNADSVHVLAINLEPESHGGKAGSGICEHLARHDIHASPIHISGTTDSLAEVMLSQARELEADLIIMGAYGHSRLRERILGSTTSDLLNKSPIAMLMTH